MPLYTLYLGRGKRETIKAKNLKQAFGKAIRKHGRVKLERRTAFLSRQDSAKGREYEHYYF